MQTEVTVLTCPSCGATVSHTVAHNGFKAGGTSIGPSAIPCPGCGIAVVSGQSEWDEKHFFQKAWFVLQRLFWWLAASFFIAGFLATIVGLIAVEAKFIREPQRMLWSLVTFGVGALLIGVILGRNAFKEIRESRQRTAPPDSW